MSPLPIPGAGVTLLAPGALAAGAGAVATLVVLHAIRVGRPPVVRLPTVRFAPDRAPHAVRRLARPADLALLALRSLAVAAVAAALARPVPTPERRAASRVVVVDASRAAEPAATRAAVATLARGGGLAAGDALVLLTAAGARTVRAPADSASAVAAWADAAVGRALADPGRERTPGSLSAALVAARRAAAATLAPAADSIELVVVSPLARETADAATSVVRATWPGRARLVATPASGASPADGTGRGGLGAGVALSGGPRDDALAAALALDGRLRAADADAPVRLVRAAEASAADQGWVRGGRGRMLVVWPTDGAPAGWRRHGADSTWALAVPGGHAAAVAPFVRSAAPADGAARPVVRWADGAPAAVERTQGAGCVREVGVAVPQTGDAALRPAFRAVVAALVAPCGAPRDNAPVEAALTAALRRDGAPLLDARPLRAALAPPAPDRLGAALLGLALAALLAELGVRGRRRASIYEAHTSSTARPADAPATPPPTAGRRRREAA